MDADVAVGYKHDMTLNDVGRYMSGWWTGPDYTSAAPAVENGSICLVHPCLQFPHCALLYHRCSALSNQASASSRFGKTLSEPDKVRKAEEERLDDFTVYPLAYLHGVSKAYRNHDMGSPIGLHGGCNLFHIDTILSPQCPFKVF